MWPKHVAFVDETNKIVVVDGLRLSVFNTRFSVIFMVTPCINDVVSVMAAYSAAMTLTTSVPTRTVEQDL